MSSPIGFPAREVRALFGIPQKALEYITINKFVVAEAAPPRGRGKARLYSTANLFQIGLLLELRAEGLEFPRAKTLMDMAQLFMNLYSNEATGVLKSILDGANYKPFNEHSLPTINFFLVRVRTPSTSYLTLHFTDDQNTYSYNAPYAAIRPNEADPVGWAMDFRTDHAIQEILRDCSSMLSINLTAISRKIEDYTNPQLSATT